MPVKGLQPLSWEGSRMHFTIKKSDLLGFLSFSAHDSFPVSMPLCTFSLSCILQFYDEGCPNCGYLQMDGDRHRVWDCTTVNFAGFLAIMKPMSSWVARHNKLSKKEPRNWSESSLSILFISPTRFLLFYISLCHFAFILLFACEKKGEDTPG